MSLTHSSKAISLIMLVSASLLFSSHAVAEKGAEDDHQSMINKEQHVKKMKARRFEKISKELELNDKQKAKIKPLLKKHKEEKRKALEPIRARHRAELSKILSEEQMKKLERMHSRKKKKK